MGKVKPVDVYVKEKINTKFLDVNYTRGKSFGIDNMKFNFSAKPVKEPYGDVSFSTGYDNNDEYTSTFLMSAEEALTLGQMLINTACEAMNIKRIILEAEGYDAKLSYLVLQDLINCIYIIRLDTKLKNYEEPYYLYRIEACKDNDIVLSYNIVYNLSYFTSEKQIDNWKNHLTNNGKVELELFGWDPYKELQEKKDKYQEDLLKALKENNIKLKPTPIKR